MTDKSAIRDAATLILVRRDTDEAHVLMGQRGSAAAFMPNKYVFPGGALDAEDRAVKTETTLHPVCVDRLHKMAEADVALPLALAAIRETFEETGLYLGRPADGGATQSAPQPPGWEPLFSRGLAPTPEALKFVFRAITPPGRSRRFDARFFLADAAAINGDLDDFSQASGELSHLTWIALSEARALEMPFITEIVLSEVEELLSGNTERPVPFFHHDDERSYFTAL